MPPTDSTLQTTIMYLSRLLSVIAMQFPNEEIRIHKSLLDEITGSDGKRALFEDFDEKTEEIVLTYRRKSRATYLVEGVPASTTQPITTTSPDLQMSGQTNSPTTHRRMPLTDDQIVKLQQKLAREKQYRAIKNEPQESFSQ